MTEINGRDPARRNRWTPAWAIVVLVFLSSPLFASPHVGLTAHRQLPTRFEPNVGQFADSIRFVARRGGATLYLGDEAATLVLRESEPRTDTRITMRVAGGRKTVPVAGQPLPTKTNYFLSNDPTRWRSDVTTYGRVTYPHVLPGVDLVYHGEAGQLEYDFVVEPGVDAKKIAIEIDGSRELSLTTTGDLVMRTAQGARVQARPRVYQFDQEGRTHEVEASYRILGEHLVAFRLGAYDSARTLVIDPVLVFSTYLGGSGDETTFGVAVDGAGAVYMAGATASTNFPTKGAVQANKAGGLRDLFVGKLNASGDVLVYATYLGGVGYEDPSAGIAVDANGNAYVAGSTSSTDFPLLGAAQATYGGGQDGFVLKLNAAGNALVYSTYLGGGSLDNLYGLAVDAGGNAYVTGSTQSTNFPTKNPLQAAHAGAPVTGFVTKLNAAGNAWVYSTYLGGNADDAVKAIAVDAAGNAYLAGYTTSANFPTVGALQPAYQASGDAFVSKLNAAGSALVYSTFLGGTAADVANAIAVDASGSAYVAGLTLSTNFPTKNPVQPTNAGGTSEGFVAKLNPAGDALSYSSYLGGSGSEQVYALAVDGLGSVLLLETTSSTDRATKQPLQATNGGGATDLFVSKLNASGNAMLYATYFGGSGAESAHAVAVDTHGGAYVVGRTDATNFTTKTPLQAMNAGLADGILVKIATPAPLLAPSALNVLPQGMQTFVASGGSGTGYVFSLTTNASGGSIDAASGAYVAGSTDHTVDVVGVTDSEGGAATANVQVSSTPPTDDAGQSDDASVDGQASGDAANITTPDAASSVASAGCSCQMSRGGLPSYAYGYLVLMLLAIGLRQRSRRR